MGGAGRHVLLLLLLMLLMLMLLLLLLLLMLMLLLHAIAPKMACFDREAQTQAIETFFSTLETIGRLSQRQALAFGKPFAVCLWRGWTAWGAVWRLEARLTCGRSERLTQAICRIGQF
jgi:hypothetical protein